MSMCLKSKVHKLVIVPQKRNTSSCCPCCLCCLALAAIAARYQTNVQHFLTRQARNMPVLDVQEFAKTFLTRQVTLHYLRGVLLAYRDLFEDMREYMQRTGDTGSSQHFFSQCISL